MSFRNGVVLVVARLAGFDRRRYLVGTLLWTLFIVVPIATGLLLKGLFDQLSGHRSAGMDTVLWLCAAFVAVELVRGVIFWFALTVWPYWWNGAGTVLRTNVLRSILTARGPAASRLPHSSGEAVSRFRDDVEDLIKLADNLVDLAAGVLFAIGAFAIMATIDPVITVVLVLPLSIVLVLTRSLSEVIRRIHSRARRLGAVVTAYIGETFGGVLAIKTAGAEEAVLERLREHNRRRRQAAVKDRLAMDLLDTATGATVEISIGLVLLLSAAAMRRGDFTVGDLALFTSYVGWLTMLPRVLGRMLYRFPQGAVAVERLTRLMAGHEDADDLSRFHGLYFRSEPPPARTEIPEPTDPLEVLEVRNLSVRHGDSGRGLDGVDLRLERGSFTVVTGAVGSGKTTLIRALLGLLPATSGTVRWNGRPIDDPGTFLVPGRAAYAGQVPRLFSESLWENLLLGWPASQEDLDRALELAALEQDLSEMPEGLETVVGPRGVRLSGGQVQRATAARALVRSPDLLVVDDLSSALDVETENLLWDRIAKAAKDGRGPSTLLVVSHRRAALERADQVLVLDRGAVVGSGSLDHVLRTCPEMQRLWSEESVVEAEEHPEPGRLVVER
ncbi:MAG TPA: ABC transporter ATP-binding protein [Actinopolymorphaceae bacterium]